MTMNQIQNAATVYSRARQDLRTALDDLTGQAQRLIRSRYRDSKRGDLIHAARLLRVEAIDIVTLAVMAERSRGASWEDVAEALTLPVKFVIEHYEPLERQWLTGNGIAPIGVRDEPLRSLG